MTKPYHCHHIIIIITNNTKVGDHSTQNVTITSIIQESGMWICLFYFYLRGCN